MNLFYFPSLQESSSEITLPEEESKHCTKVLRLSIGDTISLTDGRGFFYKAEITNLQSKRTEIKIVERNKVCNPRKNRIHMAVAPTKNINRYEWFLEKATEIGIDEITPIITSHSERKVVKHERLNKIVISAMKQSLKAELPMLHAACSFDDFIAKHKIEQGFIAYCDDVPKIELFEAIVSEKAITILIGPEGDFSPSEVKKATDCGYKIVSLGESRLRTETAAIVACHTAVLKK